ncbi:MAG: asparagine synthase-related protein, partial [Methanothrix sp.]|uniref:asparagine synthase-related protein n=1 Tax=Methanothrix sp. TaxID=90426 RepID=UPI003D29DD45
DNYKNEILSQECASSKYESWEWQERQAKFIINSVRIYEFWGYSWWLPFWDNEFMDFWSKVPIDMKINQKIYKKYVKKLFNELSNTSVDTSHENKMSFLLKPASSILKRTPFLTIARNIYRRYKLFNEYENNPFAFYGAIGKERFVKRYTGLENINSFIAADIIEALSSNSENAKKVLYEIVLHNGCV